MKQFLISLPRTRSTLIFDSLRGYNKEKYGLNIPKGHSELFLEWGRNMELYDHKTQNYFTTELYPISDIYEMKIHFIYPPVFDKTHDRNLYKLSVLQDEKKKGREYNIKGTLNLASTIAEVCAFYNDRKFIITKRDDVESMIMSFFFAWESKLFHARHNNINIYNQAMNKGVTVPDKIIEDYCIFLEQMNIIEKYLMCNNINYDVVTYEELENENVISEIIETDEWKQYRNESQLPIRIDKDYKKLIHNYSHVKDKLKDYGAL